MDSQIDRFKITSSYLSIMCQEMKGKNNCAKLFDFIEEKKKINNENF